MLKYVNTDIVFQEVPGETTLAINLSQCPCRCPGCHSAYLWGNVGEALTPAALDQLIATEGRTAITCVGFMGGDNDPAAIDALAAHVRRHHPRLKVAWYTGRTLISSRIHRAHFDYIKVGPYLRHLGPLTSPTTNQRMYQRQPDGTFRDITSRFRKAQP